MTNLLNVENDSVPNTDRKRFLENVAFTSFVIVFSPQNENRDGDDDDERVFLRQSVRLTPFGDR